MLRIYDVSAIIHSGALARYSTDWNKDYFPTGGLYKLFSYLFSDMKKLGLNNWVNPIKEDNTNNIILCMDHKVNYRKMMYPEYKANRKGNRSIIDKQKVGVQLQAIEIISKMIGIPFLQKEGYEADDLIYSVVAKYPDEQIIIRADDSDLESTALLNNRVFMQSVAGHNIGDLYKYRLAEKMANGDVSDNIPALPNEVRKLIEQYYMQNPMQLLGGNEDIKVFSQNIPKEFAPYIIRNRDLILPKIVELNDIPQINLDYDKTIDVMNALGFKKFLKSTFYKEREFGTPGEIKVITQLAPLLEDELKNYFLNLEQREERR